MFKKYTNPLDTVEALRSTSLFLRLTLRKRLVELQGLCIMAMETRDQSDRAIITSDTILIYQYTAHYKVVLSILFSIIPIEPLYAMEVCILDYPNITPA